MSFEALNLMPLILRNVHAAGYDTPTPIQNATIPLVLSGRDVLGCAQTGTGKTAAFALPIIQRLAKKPVRPGQPRTIRTLILTPTRELALQIYENFTVYGKGLPVYPAVIFGGVSQQGQVDALHRGADVVIACPGRLWDLMNQGYVRLDFVETFVLDEADRMLDMGFIHDVRRIAAKLPEKRQTLLFSATMPSEVEKLALDLLHEPESVKVDPVSSTVKKIDQYLYYVDKANKKHLLAQLLKQPDVENALVFSRTKHGVDRIVRDLKRAGIEAGGIHGDKSQNARQAALSAFKAGESRVLVATDIAARGIDIAGLSHVFNYDMPMEPEAYVHRIGRTGRAGRDGTAISFCCVDELKQLNQVEKLIGRKLPVQESDWPMEITTPSEPKPRQPRPAKLTMRGEPVPERKPHLPPAKKSLPKAGQPIIIGRDGKMKLPEAAAPVKAAKANAGKPASRPAPKANAHTVGHPVQRINRSKGQNGKRG
ncbi:MAG: DEAD/DEAH box helicase [Aristaeellaceae bacterium]